jgi:hypothetical protein
VFMKSFQTIVPFIFLVLVVSCDKGSSDANPHYSVELSGWQTYCGSETGREHVWEPTDGELTVERLPFVSSTFRSGYAFVRKGNLIAYDLSSGEQFSFDQDNNSFTPVNTDGCTQFVTSTHTFSREEGYVAACPIGGGECTVILIAENTFSFVFAEHNGKVLAASNWGDVVIFDGSEWCRTYPIEDVYRCDPNAPMVTEPRKVQFYSSITYMGVTLVGEWPTGRLFEFDGDQLGPSNLFQPPFVTGEELGYEAQSMAEYCGDLFVGYWPRGEIWRRERWTGIWSMAFRAFSHPVEEEPLIPYYHRPQDNLPAAFYGQRITALVPFGDSLYAVTSNLNEWPIGYEPEILTNEETAEYGTMYRLNIAGCETIEPEF